MSLEVVALMNLWLEVIPFEKITHPNRRLEVFLVKQLEKPFVGFCLNHPFFTQLDFAHYCLKQSVKTLVGFYPKDFS